ncbi:type II toxin-antitoxin system YafQ family toxin [candidate division KSB1 bacterium]
MNIQYTAQFRKDYKRMKRRNKNPELLKRIIGLIMQGKPLPPHYKDHKLLGEWSGHRDCHIEPDWLLIYRRSKDTMILERTGSHTDLFT